MKTNVTPGVRTLVCGKGVEPIWANFFVGPLEGGRGE